MHFNWTLKPCISENLSPPSPIIRTSGDFPKGRKWNNRKFFRKIFLRQFSLPQEIFRKEENGITGNISKCSWYYVTLSFIHCVKSIQIQNYFWSVFSCIQSENRKIRIRNNSVFGHFTQWSSLFSMITFLLTHAKFKFMNTGYDDGVEMCDM